MKVLWIFLLVGVMPLTSLSAAEFVNIAGAACTAPPALKCPDTNCPTDRIINQGPVVEMKNRRTYFLDYPCDLKPNEQVSLVLSLHGGGSYGNWQRHYFPLLDQVDTHRLVVATPNSPIRVWTEVDDDYLQNIVDHLVDQLGKQNIRSFWLAGHSQGGMTSNRILLSDYFKARVDGWISLSGGRLGGNPGRAESFGPPRSSAAAAPSTAEATERRRQMGAMFARAAALLAKPPANDISFIYTTGEREVDADGVPAKSALAKQYRCSARSIAHPIEDTKPGYVYDGSRQNPPRCGAAWEGSYGRVGARRHSGVSRTDGCGTGWTHP